MIQDLLSKKLIGAGRSRDRLYYLEPMSSEGVAMAVKRGPIRSTSDRFTEQGVKQGPGDL